MTKKATDIIAYLGIIGWLVSFFAGTRKESKFHLNQALNSAVGFLALSILSSLLPYFPLKGLIIWGLNLFLAVITIIALVGACKGEEKVMPVLGGFSILNDSFYESAPSVGGSKSEDSSSDDNQD